MAKPGGRGRKVNLKPPATVVARFSRGGDREILGVIRDRYVAARQHGNRPTPNWSAICIIGTIRALVCSLAPGGDKIEVDFKQIATQDLYLSGRSKPEKFSIQLRDCNPEVFRGDLGYLQRS